MHPLTYMNNDFITEALQGNESKSYALSETFSTCAKIIK